MPSNDVKEKKPSTAKTRYHSFMTYATLEQINKVIFNHQSSIVSYCYICHDQDETTPHYHLVIRTYDAWSPAQINKWFAFVKMETEQNTFNEAVKDLDALETYLTHTDAESVKQGKHPYDRALIKDFGLLSTSTCHKSYDDTYEIMLAMQAGMNTRELVRRYGKKFLYHYSQFVAVNEAIVREDYYERERQRPEREQLPFGWPRYETYNAPEYACVKVPADAKPIPVDNIDIEEVLK